MGRQAPGQILPLVAVDRGLALREGVCVANANLIAAAPELLETCEHALRVLTGERFPAGVAVKLAKAIAKARNDAAAVLDGRVHPLITEPPDTIRDLLRGCGHCDYDEAEGGLVDHCDACCRKVTAACWEFFTSQPT